MIVHSAEDRILTGELWPRTNRTEGGVPTSSKQVRPWPRRHQIAPKIWP